MKISWEENINKPKPRGINSWLTRLAIVAGIGILVYYGYCFGLWGRKFLLFQHLFQCNCPAISEEWRYPKQVDVIVSACRNIGMLISPSGGTLLVYENIENNGILSTRLLNLQTKDENSLILPEGDIHFLTDELIYIFIGYGHDYEGGEHIFDLRANTMYPIQKFVYARPGSYVNGNSDPNKLAEALREMQEVYFVENQDLIVALAPNFPSSSEQSFLSGWFDIAGGADDREQKFLQEHNIIYKFVPANFPGELVSPDGRFIARRDGIYLNKNDQKIVEGYTFSPYFRSYSGKYFSLRGWKYDSSGAIYSHLIGPCLLEFGFPGSDDPGCIVGVRQPIILLKVPEEYLSSTQTP